MSHCYHILQTSLPDSYHNVWAHLLFCFLYDSTRVPSVARGIDPKLKPKQTFYERMDWSWKIKVNVQTTGSRLLSLIFVNKLAILHLQNLAWMFVCALKERMIKILPNRASCNVSTGLWSAIHSSCWSEKWWEALSLSQSNLMTRLLKEKEWWLRVQILVTKFFGPNLISAKLL